MRWLQRRFDVIPSLPGLLAASLVAVASCAQTGAQVLGGKEGWTSKVGPELATLHARYVAHLASRSGGPFASTDPLVRVLDDHVLVDAVAAGDTDALKSDLAALGMREGVAFGRIVSGQLPISAIPAMAALPSLKFARAASASVPRLPGPAAPR